MTCGTVSGTHKAVVTRQLSTPVHRNITLAHIPPAHSENINFFGAIEVDIDAELGVSVVIAQKPTNMA